MKRFIQKLLNIIGVKIYYLPFNKYKRILKEEGFGRNQYKIIDEGIILYLNDKEFFLPKNILIKLKFGLRYLNDILSINHSKMGIKNGELILEIEDVLIMISNAEELFIIKEIFCDNIYNVTIEEPLIVIDVGMNVGIATLFFANKILVKKVYSYEPFFNTFKQAVSNIELNNRLKNKINMFNFGLSDKNQVLDLEYSEDYKGSSGIWGLPDYLPEKRNIKMQIISVVFKSAAQILNKILDENKNVKKLLKLDCEGSEYNIIKNLADNNLLEEFDIIIIEWHKLGPTSILEIFKDKQFYLLQIGKSTNSTGFIYAFKKTKQ